jgi:HlyD family secretion protein
MDSGLEIARKSLSAAQANFEEASRNYDRAKGLLETGAASESYLDEAERRYKSLQAELNLRDIEVERARQALDQARLAEQRLVGSVDDNEYEREVLQAEIEALEAQCAIIEEDLKKTEIRAPVSGPVLDKFIEDSRVLAEGTELLRLGDMDSIEIECDVLSEEVTAIGPGDKVFIHGKALRGKILEGTVKRIFPSGFEKISSLGVEQQRVKTLIDFDNSAAKLRPGTSVDVDIITAEAPGAFAVPDRAVFRDGDHYAVFVIENGRARVRQVDVGVRNEDWAEIRSGLDSDTIVIAELTNDIKPGIRVSPIR